MLKKSTEFTEATLTPPTLVLQYIPTLLLDCSPYCKFTPVAPPASVWREYTKLPKMLNIQSAVCLRERSCITDFSLSRGLLGKSGIILVQMKWETTEVRSGGCHSKAALTLSAVCFSCFSLLLHGLSGNVFVIKPVNFACFGLQTSGDICSVTFVWQIGGGHSRSRFRFYFLSNFFVKKVISMFVRLATNSCSPQRPPPPPPPSRGRTSCEGEC